MGTCETLSEPHGALVLTDCRSAGFAQLSRLDQKLHSIWALPSLRLLSFLGAGTPFFAGSVEQVDHCCCLPQWLSFISLWKVSQVPRNGQCSGEGQTLRAPSGRSPHQSSVIYPFDCELLEGRDHILLIPISNIDILPFNKCSLWINKWMLIK